MARTVFFDACVFFPQSARDISMEFAVAGFYQAKWSELVERQFVKNVEEKKPHTKGKLQNTLMNMRKAVPDYFAEATEEPIQAVRKSKTDKGDVDILAAAIDSGCDTLVTFNLRDFDAGFASENGVKVMHPDEFFVQVINSVPDLAKEHFQFAVARTRKPARTYKEYCLGVEKNNLKKTSELLLRINPS